MNTRTSGHTDEPISEHLETFRDYAKRVIIDGNALSPGEDAYKEAVFERIAALGGALRMSEREMVSLMLRGVFTESPPCWCTKCRASYLDGE